MGASDVVVVGGGAIGIACAYALTERGARVTVLERGPRLATGCSGANAGLICPSHSLPIANPRALRDGLRWLLSPDSPFYIRPRPAIVPWLARFALASTAAQAEAGERAVHELSVESLRLHAELAELGTSFERRGTLNVYETEAGLAAAHGKRLTPEAVRELEPAVRGEIAGGVYHADEAHCDSRLFVEAVARASGAEIRTGVEVRRIRHGRVETSEGDLQTGTVVLAAGAWSGRLGIRLPLQGGKGYSVTLEAAPGDPSIPVFLQEARTVATPLGAGLRLSGTMELAGLDLRIDKRRVEAIRSSVARVLGWADTRRVGETWAGLRPCLPDGLPAIGSAGSCVIATGHAMKGLSLAPVTGKLVAELVAGDTPIFDLTPFRPDRFRW